MQQQPNILFVMSDQLTSKVLASYGSPIALTPNLDDLAARGTVFSNSYCNVPCCAPSRASLMTGRLASRVPVNDNSEELPASVPTFLHHLRYAGYQTVLSGKMHFVGPDQLHGFEERLTTDIFPDDFLWSKYWPAQGNPPRWAGRPVGGEVGPHYDVRTREWGQLVQEAGLGPWNYQIEHDEEAQFLALQRIRALSRRTPEEHRPWFMCVSFTQPHDPYIALEEYWRRYEGVDIPMPEPAPHGHLPHKADEWVNAYHGLDRLGLTDDDVYRARRAYLAMTSFVDDKLGELIVELKKLDLYDNTIIIFTSDHGDQLGQHGMWDKLIHREWSTRVPLIMAGPGIAAGRQVDQNVSLVDLFPTICELGAATSQLHIGAADRAGSSLVSFLRGGVPADWDNTVTIESNGEGTIRPIRALIRDRSKFVYVHGEEDQYFDLMRDPMEWRNLAADSDHANDVAKLRSEMFETFDPDRLEAEILASQRNRVFLKNALYEGAYTSWSHQPFVDASTRWVRRHSNRQWDPDLGFSERRT